MRIDARKAAQIVDSLSGRVQKNGSSQDIILEIGLIIRDFGLDKQYWRIGSKLRALQRNPNDKMLARLLLDQVRKVLSFYREERNPFVVKPSAGDFKGEIPLARCGSTIYRMSLEQACLHLGVFGRTGSGKTSFAYNLFLVLNRLGIPCIWIDTSKKSGRNLITECPDTLVIQFRNKSQFKFNIMKPPPGVEIQKWRSALGEVLSTTMETFLGTRNYFFSHLTELMKMENPYFELLYKNVLNDKVSYQKNPRSISYREGAMFRLRAIWNEVGPVLDCLDSYPVISMLQEGRSMVLETTDSSPDVTIFNALAFFAWVGCWLEKQSNPQKTLKYFIIIDEGNDIFGAKTKGKNDVLLSLMRTIRSAGGGVYVGAQNISRLEQELVGNLFCRIALSTSDGRDIQALSQSMMFTSNEQIEAILRLQTFEGIVRTPAFPALFPVTIQPHFLRDVTDEEVWENNARILQHYSYTPVPSSTVEIKTNNVEKSETQPQCQETQKIKTENIEISEEAKKLVRHAWQFPYLLSSVRCSQLSFSGSVGKRAIKELVEKGLAVILPVKTGPGRGKTGKVIVLDDKAASFISETENMRYGRAGNLNHLFVEKLLKHHLSNMGLKVEMEMSRNQKCVDLGIIKADGTITAIEYECRFCPHVQENLEKDLSAGFSRVISVSATESVLRKTQKLVRELGLGNRVDVCLLADILKGTVEI